MTKAKKTPLRSYRVGLVGYIQKPARLAEIRIRADSPANAEWLARIVAAKQEPRLSWEAVAL